MNEKSKLSSVLGGTLSALLVLICIFASTYLGKELFSRTDPISRFDYRNLEDTNIPLKDFPVAFSIFGNQEQDFLLKADFLEVYSFKVLLIAMNEGESGNMAFGRVSKCTSDIVKPEFYEELMKTKSHLSKLCIDTTNLISLTGIEYEPIISKPFGYDGSSSLSLIIERCLPSDPKCKEYTAPREIHVVVYTEDSFTEVSDYESPIKYSLSQHSNPINGALMTRRFFEINWNKLVTDDSWFTQNNSALEWLSLGAEKTEANLITDTYQTQAIYTFTGPLRQKVYSRRYVKVQEILGNLGGFFKVLTLIAKGLLTWYSDLDLYNFVVKTDSKLKMTQPAVAAIRAVGRERDSSLNQIEPINTSKPKIDLLQFILGRTFKSKANKYKFDFSLVQKRLDITGLIRANDLNRPIYLNNNS